jgi:catechol 2,3-dioxygenase-like lactoylglutathione lyase family enzyme
MKAQTKQLTPTISVANVPRSIAFYEHLGFAVTNSVTPEEENEPSWVWLSLGEAHLMLTYVCDPILPEQ